MSPRLRFVAATFVIGVLALASCGENPQLADALETVDTEAPAQLDSLQIDATSGGTTPGDRQVAPSVEELLSGEAVQTIVAVSQAEALETAEDLIEDTTLSGSSLAPEGRVTNWSGVIGDGTTEDGIAFTMWLAQEGEFVHGELTYASSGVPITVIGEAHAGGDSYFLREFRNDGRVTGTLIFGDVTDGVVSNASWDDLDLSLTFVGIDSEPFSFNPQVSGGQYNYSFPGLEIHGFDEDSGPAGSLQLVSVSESFVEVSFDNYTTGPGFNQAVVPSTQVPLDENVARYEETDGDFIDCAFDITIFERFAFVDHVDGRFDCGFGHNAGVEGIYLYTEGVAVPVPNLEPVAEPTADPLEDDEPAGASLFTNARLTPTSYGPISLGDSWTSLIDQFGVASYDPAIEVTPDCHHVFVQNGPLEIGVMLLGDGENAVVSRIELWSADQLSDSGFGVGNTEAELDAFYGDELIKDPHGYLGEGAKYIRVVPADGQDSTILFVTNESGMVIGFRNGYLDPVRWVEGCL